MVANFSETLIEIIQNEFTSTFEVYETRIFAYITDVIT